MLIKLPIASGLYKNLDAKALPGNRNAEMRDCYVDEAGNIHRRPGLTELCDLGTSKPIDGLYWWPEQSMAIAVSDTKTFKITDKIGTNSQLTNNTFQARARVHFDNWGTALYAANGAKIQGISTAAVTEMADADAPTTVSHVGILDKYLLANEVGTQKFHRSNVNAPTDWDGNYDETEAESDNLMALGVANLELFLLGARTLEMWRDDGATPFVRELQGYVQSGTLAKHSFVWCNGTWLWLDQNRQFVILDSRTAKIISLAINDYVQGFNIVTDCMADFILFRGRPFALFTFPSDEKTLVYDFIKDFWYEWSYWHPVYSEYKRWPGNCSCLAEAWGMTLIGDKVTGKIYKLDQDAYTDNGSEIRTMIQTAHIDWGSMTRRKRCNSLTFRFKGKNVPSGTTYKLMVKWRDNGADAWSNERTVALHSYGGNILKGRIDRLGMYYSRQWEFSITDNVELILTSVEEDFEVMNS